MTRIQVAIDGPAASGKSTTARLVAEQLGGIYVNTGAMYRSLTKAALDRGINPETQPEAVSELLDELELSYRLEKDGTPQLYLNEEAVDESAIRAPEVGAQVSFVARIPEVRAWLLERQRETGKLGTIVMEGRDIGTVVLPNASHKFFITATPEERARRRLAQDGEVAAGATLAEVAAEIAKRDKIDSTRAVSPLRRAENSIEIITDGLTPAEVTDLVVSHIRGEK